MQRIYAVDDEELAEGEEPMSIILEHHQVLPTDDPSQSIKFLLVQQFIHAVCSYYPQITQSNRCDERRACLILDACKKEASPPAR